MKYEYRCTCGYLIIYETDSKPPKNIKCKQCKKKIEVKK